MHRLRFVARTLVTLTALLLALPLASQGCSSKNSLISNTDAGSTQPDCTHPPTLEDDTYSGCATCSFQAGATPTACTPQRSINACCDYVQKPTAEIQRGVGLHYFSSSDPTVNLGCLAAPATAGPSQNVTLSGYVKLFANGDDSQGVKVEIFKADPTTGALGASMGTYTTSAALDPTPVVETWSSKCPSDGCKLRHFQIKNVPTETPLVIKTSDAAGSGLWADLYDYNIYLTDSPVPGAGDPNCTTPPCYNPSAVAATDINTVAASAGGFTIKPDKGVMAGEVHDCGDVRIEGATVDTDQAHEGPIFYFNQDEANPVPDNSRAQGGLGTSTLSLFGALNIATGVPIRVSATGIYQGKLTLLGTYVVQTFPGAVTALSFRGRRPFQQ